MSIEIHGKIGDHDAIWEFPDEATIEQIAEYFKENPTVVYYGLKKGISIKLKADGAMEVLTD